MTLYDKRDDFPFKVQNSSHLDSNVPCMPMYGVNISQLLRFAPACDRYLDFLARHKRLVWTLLDQGFQYGFLCRKFNSFTGPTIPWSSVIPTLWRSICRRVLTVGFGDGVSAFCWLMQRCLAPIDYQFTLSLVSCWLFPSSFFCIDFLKISIFIIFSFLFC